MTERFSHPLIVVAIPAYNEAKHIGEAIASLRAQTHTDFLAVVSDNASTDGTPEVAETAIAGDPRFRIVRHEVNKGAVYNFRYVLDASESPYFMWLGAHDVIAPTFLERHLAAMEADPEVSLSYAHTRWIDEEGNELRVTNAGGLAHLGRTGVERYLRSAHTLRECTAINNVIRRRCLGSLNGHEVASADNVMLSRLLLLGRANEVAEPLYWRRDFKAKAQDYMQRMTGKAGMARDMRPMIGLYARQADELLAGRPDRWLVKQALLYILRRRFTPGLISVATARKVARRVKCTLLPNP